MATRTRKNLNMRVPEDWIRERREAMALCGCTNLSDWIRTMVEEGEAHALTRSVPQICAKCRHWRCVDPVRMMGECMAPRMRHPTTMGENTCEEWRRKEGY